MKKDSEIKKWLEKNRVSISDMMSICWYLQTKGEEIPKIKAFRTENKATYDDFVDWYSDKVVSTDAPFKKGEWLRHTTSNDVFQVEEIELVNNKWFLTKKPYIVRSADKCEKFIPKRGEFWTISNVNDTWIDCMEYYCYCLGIKDGVKNVNLSNGWESYANVVEVRPSTEPEIGLLIQEVEKGYKQTYLKDKKEWVDMPIKEEINIIKPLIDEFAEQMISELDNSVKEAKIAKIAVANSEAIELLVKAGVLKDPSNPDDTRSYNVGKSDYTGKSIIEPWTLWYLWDFLTSWDHDIIKRLYRTKEGTSRIEDYKKIIHDCKERIRQLNHE